MELARQPATRLHRILGSELQAVRTVDRERVDREALQRLQHSLPAAPEEGDTLGDLGVLRPVLEQEDVAERVSRAEDRHVERVTESEELMAEIVDLGDRPLLVTLVDFVGRHGRHGSRDTFSLSGPSP